MADIIVIDAVEAHVRSVFSACPLFVENEAYEAPNDGSPFLVLGFPYARSEQASIGAPGNNLWKEEGAFTLTLSMPRGAGTRTGRAWLDEIARTLRGVLIGSVRCQAPQSPVLDDGNGDEPYVGLIMAVPYRLHLTG